MQTKLKQTHKNWLLNRGISEAVLDEFKISSAYSRIVIPIKDSHGIIIFNKYRRDPEEDVGAKYTYDTGASIRLFNIGVLEKVNLIIICEGELDVLCLYSKGLNAVTSTGGAQSFQKDWVPFFKDMEVFVCLDNDEAGLKGTIKICQMIPHAKVIPLPQGIKDATDFFAKYTYIEFKALMNMATPLPVIPLSTEKKTIVNRLSTGTRIQQAKNIPISDFLIFNVSGKARCPFHTDKTASLQRYKDNNTWYYETRKFGF